MLNSVVSGSSLTNETPVIFEERSSNSGGGCSVRPQHVSVSTQLARSFLMQAGHLWLCCGELRADPQRARGDVRSRRPCWPQSRYWPSGRRVRAFPGMRSGRPVRCALGSECVTPPSPARAGAASPPARSPKRHPLGLSAGRRATNCVLFSPIPIPHYGIRIPGILICQGLQQLCVLRMGPGQGSGRVSAFPNRKVMCRVSPYPIPDLLG